MRKILHIFLSLVIVYATTTSAYANTSIGGWTATDTIIAGATTTINAIKNGANGALKSAVTVAPSASKVGKFLIKGGGTAALLIAVPQLIGDGVDWVLDPDNNAVKYKLPPDIISAWVIAQGSSNETWGSTPESTFRAYSAKIGQNITPKPNRKDLICTTHPNGLSSNCLVEEVAQSQVWYKPQNAPVPTEEWKSIPIDTVAAQVISNAAAGDVPSQDAVKATALEGFSAGENDAALDSAAQPATDTDTPADPTDPTDPTDPAVPFDPSSIIAAINALKALLAGILSSITGLSDLFNDTPPEKTQEETDVPVEAPPDVKNPNEFDVDYIGFSSQCPTLQPFSVGIGAASSSMTFDMTPLCELAVTIRPAIIAIAYFIGLGVIASAIRET